MPVYLPGHRCCGLLKVVNSALEQDSDLCPLPCRASNEGEEVDSKKIWDVVAVTAHQSRHAEAFAKELENYFDVSSCDKIIPVSDLEGEMMGSGGATLHALFQIVEYLSAKAGDPYHNEQRLKGKAILIIHTGGSSFNPVPWAPTPDCDTDGLPQTNIAALLSTLASIEKRSTTMVEDCDVWICSAEMLTGIDSGISKLNWGQPGVTVLSAPCSLRTASEHGTYKLVSDNGNGTYTIKGLAYKSSTDNLEHGGFLMNSGLPSMILGMVRMDYTAAAAFFSLHAMPPFSSCTPFGVDDGLDISPFSLFLDVVPALLATDSFFVGIDSTSSKIDELRKRLSGRFGIQAVLSPSNDQAVRDVLYVQSSRDCLKYTMGSNESKEKEDSCILLNTILTGSGIAEPGSVMVNCEIGGYGWKVARGSVAIGVQSRDHAIDIPENCTVQEVSLMDASDQVVVLVYGTKDLLYVPYTDENATFLGKPWSDFFERTGSTPDDLWKADETKKTLATAKLFSLFSKDQSKSGALWFFKKEMRTEAKKFGLCGVSAGALSLKDTLNRVDLKKEFDKTSEIVFRIDHERVRSVLTNRLHSSLQNVYNRCASRGELRIFDLLDDIAGNGAMDVSARALAHIADVLAAFAGNGGGLRSGPARNREWNTSLSLLTNNETRAKGVMLMSDIRSRWMSNAEMMIRAARHYEGAGQRLIRLATGTCRDFMSIERLPVQQEETPVPAVGQWIVTRAPARIDIAGGWTDAPPIAFENGGAVTNIAVKIDGECPVGAKARLINDPILVFKVGKEVTICNQLSDIFDYCTPHAPAALLKCAVICSGIVDVDLTDCTLTEQLHKTNDGMGLELHSWSNLPTGSGMGTSSILASCLVEAVVRVSGRTISKESLVHAVLLVEQMLTTGGGWQDQVGGIYGGAKIATSQSNLPLHVTTKSIILSDTFREQLNKHLVAVYSGRQRLARGLLQNVVRRWYARVPEMMKTINNLTDNALDAANALKEGNLSLLGNCLTKYWEQKKCMAAGCEPDFIAKIIIGLNDIIYGATLAGAGGGGFLILITKKPNAIDILKDQLISMNLNVPGLTFHKMTVDIDGISSECISE